MPRVPGSQGPRIAPAPVPSARITQVPGPDSFGAQVGDTLSRLGSRVLADYAAERQREAEEQRARFDELAVLQARNNFDLWESENLYGEKGALRTRGQQAIDVYNPTMEAFTAKANELSGTLANERQKLAFQRYISSRSGSLADQLNRHIANEADKLEDAEHKAFLDNRVQRAGQNATDPGAVAVALAEAEQEVLRMAARNGLSPESDETQARVLAAKSRIHEAVIANLVTDEPAKARGYFALYEDEIDAEKTDDIKRLLKNATDKQTAQDVAEQILREGGTLTEQRKKAKDRADGDVQDQVLSYLEHEYNIQKTLDRDAKENVTIQAANILEQTKSLPALMRSPVWLQMTMAQRDSARNYLKALQSGGVVTDFTTLATLIEASGSQDQSERQAFIDADLMQFRDRIAPNDLEQLLRAQAALRRSESDAAKKLLESPFTNVQVYNQVLDQVGIKPNTPEAGQLLGRAMNDIARLQQQLGRDLTYPELQKVYDDLLFEVEIPVDWWWDTKKRSFELEIEDVPVDARVRIENRLKANGIRTTDWNIIREYVIEKQQQPEAAFGGSNFGATRGR